MKQIQSVLFNLKEHARDKLKKINASARDALDSHLNVD